MQKISNYALDSNMKAAKFKTKLATRMAKKNNWTFPQVYQNQQTLVEMSPSSALTREMNDSSASEYY